MSDGPLAGVDVVELSSNIAGPFAGKLLGDMGAHVVKVERPGVGDSVRARPQPYDRHGTDGLTYRFLNYNTSKEGLAMNLKTDEGKDALEGLIESADVVLENMRPGSMDRLGMGWETMRELNPGLVYCSITGYGDGPYADRPAVDTMIQGISGFASQIGDDEFGTMDVLVADMSTGLYAALGTVMALFSRATGGSGQRVDVTMLDTMVSFLGHHLAEYTGDQRHDDYEADYGAAFAPNDFFETADDYIALYLTQDYWARFCATIDREAWADPNHRYGTNESRLAHREELHADLEAVFGTATTEEWLDTFDAADGPIPAAPVNDIAEMVADPQVQAQDAVQVRDHPVLGTHWLPNVVPKFSETPGDIGHAPELGGDTETILREMGYGDADIENMRAAGAFD